MILLNNIVYTEQSRSIRIKIFSVMVVTQHYSNIPLFHKTIHFQDEPKII